MNQIKVMLVDDDENWIYAMISFFKNEEDIKIVEVANSKEEAVHKASVNDIDIILMDISFSDNNVEGIYAAVEISELNRGKVIMLSGHDFEESVLKSFVSGAVNYVQKKNYKRLPTTIRNVYKAKSPIEILANEFLKISVEQELDVLTKSEKTVFEMVNKGYSRREISNKLNRSYNTVKNQISSVIKKLAINSSEDAITKLKIWKIKNTKS